MRHFYPLILIALCAIGCSKENGAYTDHTTPVKLAPYLYEITFNNYNINKATDFFTTLNESLHGGACSAVRNGNFIGRNLDFFYDNTAEFIVHVPAAAGRYGSVGVSSCDFFLSTDIVDSGKRSPYIDLIPYFTVDGVNDQGVYASINMVSTGDLGCTTGTNPGATTLCASMVVRYVLDNFKTAQEACQALEKMNISTVSVMGEFHYLIADATDTYMVEIIDNHLVCSKDAGKIITNYHLLHDGYTPHAMGIERFNILKEHYDEGATLEGMSTLMQRVKYSQAYDPATNPVWYSDFNSFVWNGEMISSDTPRNVVDEYIKYEWEQFQHKTRDIKNGLWITVHESVYDISEKTLRVYSQEDYTKYYSAKIQ